MITLLHGDQTDLSRAAFTRMKDAATQKEVLDGRTLDETTLTQALTSQSMFGGDKTVFIDNLFSKMGRKLTLIERLTAVICQSTVDVVLWEEKEVGATVIKNLGNVDVRLFKSSPLIFKFLDAPSLPLYQKLVETEPAELVQSMLVKRIRQLIQLKDGVMPEGVNGWQAGRLTEQAKRATMDKLLFMYKKLLDAEVSIKNGSSPFTLEQLTEQLLIAIQKEEYGPVNV